MDRSHQDASGGTRDPGRRKALLALLVAVSGVVWLLSASPALAAPPDSPVCDLPGAMLGTPGDDMINGTPGPDIICGLGGNDTISGGGGDDVIDGGLGTDHLVGDNGTDTLTYEGRTNSVGVREKPGGGFGGEGCDPFMASCAGGENDLAVDDFEGITGGFGSDSLIGGQLHNILNGGPGNAPDTLCGDIGEDTVDYSDRTAPVDVSLDGTLAPFPGPPPAELGPAVRESCLGIEGTAQEGLKDCIANDGQAGEGDCVGRDVENVIGGPGNDTLTGDDPSVFVSDPNAIVTGVNVLDGGQGDDILNGRGSADTLIGGPGNDTVTYADRSESVMATIDGAANDGGLGDFDPISLKGDSIPADVENIVGGSGSDTLKGDGNANTVSGGPGDDSLNGGGGNDSLFGGAGGDRLEGAGGNDGLSGESGDDILDGGSGADVLDGGTNNDSLRGGSGPDSMAGGDGSDVADYSDALVSVNASPNGAGDDGAAGEGDNVAGDVEGANGGIGADVLIGNAGDGTLNGGAGEDFLDGGAGSDTLIGGAGFDTASYASRSPAVTVNLASAGGDGQAGENDNVNTEKVVGGSANDTLTGDASANVLNGGRGNDKVSGGGGADLLHGDAGADTLDGNDGRDILNGDAGNDRLQGGKGNDNLLGGDGDDSLDGGADADNLSGGPGSDTATYSGRTRKVNVILNGGSPNDGEVKEGDTARADIENVKTGSGSDRIDSRDGKRGSVSCGPGRDRVRSDKRDRVAKNCEVVNNKKNGKDTSAKKKSKKKKGKGKRR